MADTIGQGGSEKIQEDWLAKDVRWFIYLLAIVFSLFHLWIAGPGIMSMAAARHIHLILSMSLVFLVYPLSKKSPRHWTFFIDLILIVLAAIVGIYLEIEVDELVFRAGEPNTLDIVFGLIACLLTLEMSRRIMGWSLAVTAALFVAYAWLGNYIPGYFGHRGYDLSQQIDAYYIELRGIYGSSLGVVVEMVVLFVVFGAFLKVSGGGEFLIELAYAVTGPMRGGPAKTEVVSSALFGTISGSATANVMGTGVFTIPMMKKVGYPSHLAAAIECASSLGGVLMPPVMGAAACLVVANTRNPYREVCKAAALPAVMYYISVYAVVHFTACKLGIMGVPVVGSYWKNVFWTLIKGIPFLVPIGLLFTLLMVGFSAHYSAVSSILTLVIIGCIKRKNRLGFRSIMEALVQGAKGSLVVSSACASVGFGVAVVAMTGLGVKLSSLIAYGTGGSVFLAILLVAVASCVIGIELPITASYLVMAILAAPGLQMLGLPVLVTHLIIMWLSIDAAVTPPVAVTAFVAAGIAEADPFKTSFTAWMVAKGIYLIPFMMAYTPITLNGSLGEIVFAFIAGSVGLVSLAAGMHGWLIYRTNWLERVVLLSVAGSTITPWQWPRLAGLAVFCGLCLIQWLQGRGTEPATSLRTANVDVELKAKEVKIQVDERHLDMD
jgi:TRAP transporter 4TM/12TM fusion protein